MNLASVIEWTPSTYSPNQPFVDVQPNTTSDYPPHVCNYVVVKWELGGDLDGPTTMTAKIAMCLGCLAKYSLEQEDF